MRTIRPRRMLMIGLVAVSVIMFYRYLIWQLEFSSVLPLISSSQRFSFSRLKQKILNGRYVNDAHCLSSRQPENVTTSKKRRSISPWNINKLIADSGLRLQEAYVSNTQSLFSPEAIMISELPHFNARIPAVVYHKNTFLAFCEARFEGMQDYGEMMIAMRRGHLTMDGDVRWENIQLIAGVRTFRTMNPSPVVDTVNDYIVLVFAGFPSSMSFHDMMSFPSFPLSKLYVMMSYDLGQTWTEPNDISGQTILNIKPNPVLLVPGPGHSIQMKCGRIIVPINYFTHDEHSVPLENMCANCTNLNRIIYSDNGGIDWSVGDTSKFTRDGTGVPIYLNEVQAVEVDDNAICLNTRTLKAKHPRAITVSLDGGKTLSRSYLAKELIEPGYKKDGKPVPGAGCEASVIGFRAPSDPSRMQFNKRWVLFSNPADGAFRRHLSIRLSIDGCRSWSLPWRIYREKAAYSDLAYFEGFVNNKRQHMIAILFEGGVERVQEGLRFKMFNLEAVLSGIKSEYDLNR
ncbi:sialidase-3-like isoform X2 [Apostichopus japonicus]